jgi:predicted ribonuclease toxin of YeeF-YezG toxin-antitoxin module
MIKAIKHIVSKIDDKINLGKQATEEFKAELDKHTGATP